MRLRLSVYHLWVYLLLRASLLTTRAQGSAIAIGHPLPLLALKGLHLLERDRIVHDRAQVLAAVRLDDDQVAHPDVEREVGQVEQVRAPGFELDDVQRPGRGNGRQRDALAEIVEIGRGCVRGASLYLLGVIGPLLRLNRPTGRRRERGRKPRSALGSRAIVGGGVVPLRGNVLDAFAGNEPCGQGLLLLLLRTMAVVGAGQVLDIHQLLLELAAGRAGTCGATAVAGGAKALAGRKGRA